MDYDYWGRLISQYRDEFKAVSERIPTIWVNANIDFLKDERYVKNVTRKANNLLKRIVEKKKRDTSTMQQRLPVAVQTPASVTTVQRPLLSEKDDLTEIHVN